MEYDMSRGIDTVLRNQTKRETWDLGAFGKLRWQCFAEDWNEKRRVAVSEVRREILGINEKEILGPKEPFKSDYAQRSFFVKELNMKGNADALSGTQS